MSGRKPKPLDVEGIRKRVLAGEQLQRIAWEVGMTVSGLSRRIGKTRRTKPKPISWIAWC